MNLELTNPQLLNSQLLISNTAVVLIGTRGTRHLIDPAYNFTSRTLLNEANAIGNDISDIVDPSQMEEVLFLESLRHEYGVSDNLFSRAVVLGEGPVAPIKERVEARLGKYATHTALSLINLQFRQTSRTVRDSSIAS